MLREQIRITAMELDLREGIIEKDFHVTRAIHCLTDIQHEYFQLVFQGGTSLAKGHRILHRMSEDCDFRMISKPTTQFLGKEKVRKSLREFRHLILENLEKTGGFTLDKDKIYSRNMGSFMRVFLPYSSLYEEKKGLRPDILLEFIAIDTKTPLQKKPVTSLIQETLGPIVNHGEKHIDCVSIIETAAEKWIALTRRIANIDYRGFKKSDAHLVRHIYDILSIYKKIGFDTLFYTLIAKIMSEDQENYKHHNLSYYEKPLIEINRALKNLQTDPAWEKHWEHFNDSMVYDKQKISYEEAISVFSEQSHLICQHLDTILQSNTIFEEI